MTDFRSACIDTYRMTEREINQPEIQDIFAQEALPDLSAFTRINLAERLQNWLIAYRYKRAEAAADLAIYDAMNKASSDRLQRLVIDRSVDRSIALEAVEDEIARLHKVMNTIALIA